MKLGGWREEALVAAAGLTGVVLYFLFENIALTYTTASNVGVIVAVNPFFTALLSSLLLRDEKLHPVFFAGFALAMAGIVLISWEGWARAASWATRWPWRPRPCGRSTPCSPASWRFCATTPSR